MEKKPLNFNSSAWFNFGCGENVTSGTAELFQHPREVWVRHSYDVSKTPHCVSYFKQRGSSELIWHPPPLYQRYPIPIKKAKADDLRKLLAYIPSEYHSFYANLPSEDIESDSDRD